MAFAEFDGVRALRQLQTANDEISGDFLKRTQILDRIRSQVYVSGTYVRDFLLEPDEQKAEPNRRAFMETRAAMDAAVSDYQAVLQPEEAALFQSLKRELSEYWTSIRPSLDWDAAQRRRAGYVFLRDDVFARRTTILAATDQISALATVRLGAEKKRVAAAYIGYRRRLTVIIGFTIGLGFLLAAFSIRQVFALEKETTARFHEISRAREALQDLSARLVAAQEEERKSIARELHDEVGQSLTGVLVEMANLSTLIRSGNVAALEPKAIEIKKLVEDSIAVVRNMALLLRPAMLDDLGLLPALQWQAREIGRRSDIHVKIAAEGVPEDLSDDLKTCIYRVVQEALHNVLQHARADTVRVSLRAQDGSIYLTIQDNGRGFPDKSQRGMGLLGMEERVSHLGGSFAVDSKPGEGTLLRVVLPAPK